MAVETVSTGIGDVIKLVGGLALWLQALGIIVVLWIVFEIIMLSLNLKRMREVYAIKKDMKRIEAKIDKILRNP
ncbi:MAG: hypothetical protein AABW65_01415 [Nanoarchaeota archaeon]